MQVRALRHLNLQRADGGVVSIAQGSVIVLTHGNRPGKFLQGYEEGHPESVGLFAPTLIRLQVVAEEQVVPLTPKAVEDRAADSTRRESVVDAIRREVKEAGGNNQLEEDRAASQSSSRRSIGTAASLPAAMLESVPGSTWSAESWMGPGNVQTPRDLDPMFIELVLAKNTFEVLPDNQSAWCK